MNSGACFFQQMSAMEQILLPAVGIFVVAGLVGLPVSLFFWDALHRLAIWEADDVGRRLQRQLAEVRNQVGGPEAGGQGTEKSPRVEQLEQAVLDWTMTPAISQRPFWQPMLTGFIERLSFSSMVWLGVAGWPTAAAAWIALKMVAGWNTVGTPAASKTGVSAARLVRFAGLQSSACSIGWAVLGGYVARGFKF